MKISNSPGFLAVIAATAAIVSTSQAVPIVIDTPLTLETPGVVGIINGQPFSPNVPNEIKAAQALLDLGPSATDGAFMTSSTDYNGTITNGHKVDGGDRTVDAGFEYAIAKYNGKNGGFVLFFLGGMPATLPMTSANLWTNGQGNGYGLSHHTGLNRMKRVPDAGATLGLFGLALAGLGIARRTLRKG